MAEEPRYRCPSCGAEFSAEEADAQGMECPDCDEALEGGEVGEFEEEIEEW